MINRFCYTSTIILLVAVLFTNAAAWPQGGVLQATATFSSDHPGKCWSVPVKSEAGQTLYILSLEPDFDVWRHVVTLEMALRYPHAKADSRNLLDPTGKAHGLQSYDFAATDLMQGVDKSAFGKMRSIMLKELGLVLEITLLNAKVTPTPSGGYQIAELEAHVSMHHINSVDVTK
jgi:hypothetical protein